MKKTWIFVGALAVVYSAFVSGFVYGMFHWAVGEMRRNGEPIKFF